MKIKKMRFIYLVLLAGMGCNFLRAQENLLENFLTPDGNQLPVAVRTDKDPQIRDKISIVPDSGNGKPCYVFTSEGFEEANNISFTTQPITTIADGCYLLTFDVKVENMEVQGENGGLRVYLYQSGGEGKHQWMAIRGDGSTGWIKVFFPLNTEKVPELIKCFFQADLAGAKGKVSIRDFQLHQVSPAELPEPHFLLEDGGEIEGTSYKF